MEDHAGEHESVPESVVEKINEKFHGHCSSSSSSDSNDKKADKKSFASAVKFKFYRLFGRERPVHKVLGGSKPADIFLWRDKKISGAMLGVATAVWVLFELLEYPLLTLICHILIIALALLFIWSHAMHPLSLTSPLRKIPKYLCRKIFSWKWHMQLGMNLIKLLLFYEISRLGKM